MCPNGLTALIPAGIGVFGAILGSTIGAFVSYRFIAIREFTSACGELHAAFAHVKVVLENRAGNKPPRLFTGSIAIHEKAIARFRFQLPKRRRPAFDAACDEYRKYRISAEGEEVLGFRTLENRASFLKAINQILSYADEAEAPRLFPSL